MACELARQSLTKEQEKYIADVLTLYPTLPYNPKARFQPTPTPIRFFYATADRIRVPYKFAELTFKFVPNAHLSHRVIPAKFTGTFLPHQAEVLPEILAQLQRFGTTLIGLYPGAGKTVLGAYCACLKQLLTVIVIPREPLIASWKSTFATFTNAKVWVVGAEAMPAEFDVIILMDGRLNQIPVEVIDQVGTLIIDEGHMLCTPSRVGVLLGFKPKYIVVETATLERDDDMHVMIQHMIGKHGVFRTNPKPFNVIKVMTDYIPRPMKDAYSELVNDISSSLERNMLIVRLTQLLPNEKFMILTARTEQTYFLHELFQKIGESSDYLCGQGKSTYNDCRILVATMGKAGVGFDAATVAKNYDGKPIRVVVLAASIKKYGPLEQYVGRSFRHPDPLVYYLVDRHKIIQRHWNLASKWFVLRLGILGQLDQATILNTPLPKPKPKLIIEEN